MYTTFLQLEDNPIPHLTVVDSLVDTFPGGKWANKDLDCQKPLDLCITHFAQMYLSPIDPVLKSSKIQWTLNIYWSRSYSSHARMRHKGWDWIGGGLDHQDALMLVIIDPPGGVWCYYFQHLIVTNLSFIACNKAKTKLRCFAFFLTWHDVITSCYKAITHVLCRMRNPHWGSRFQYWNCKIFLKLICVCL